MCIGENSTVSKDAFQDLSSNTKVCVPAAEVDAYKDYGFKNLKTFITLDEASTEVPYWENGSHSAVLKRTMVKGKWNTFNVPFDIDADEAENYFGKGAKIKQLVGISDDGVITFKDTTAIAAGYPYLVKNTADLSSRYSFGERTVWANKEIDTREGDININVYKEDGEDMAIAGFTAKNYATLSVYFNTNVNIYNMTVTPYILSGDKFYRVDSDVELRGTRWFIADMSNMSAKSSLSIDFGDADESEATGISAVGAAKNADSNTYNILGQKINANAKGLVIVNGRKLLRK